MAASLRPRPLSDARAVHAYSLRCDWLTVGTDQSQSSVLQRLGETTQCARAAVRAGNGTPGTPPSPSPRCPVYNGQTNKSPFKSHCFSLGVRGWVCILPVYLPGVFSRCRPVAMVLSPVSKLRVFQLLLSGSGRSFYCSGDKVSGSVQLEAAQLCSLTGLRVTAAGCARTEPRGGKNRRSRGQEVEYLRYEEELRLEEALSTDSDGYFLLPPGKTFSFQFGFELPPAGRLVSSYKGKFGSIRYYVRAELQRPSQNPLQCETEFEVEEPLDVNRPDLLAPVAAAVQRKVRCLFIPDGQVSISAQIERRGFCEGEDISIFAKFENTCSRIVVPKAAIIAKQSYAVDGHTKVFRQKLSAVRGNHIISGMCDMWQGKTIRVPKLRPTLLGCDIIKVDYALMIYLHIPGSEKLTLELPIVIGTVPFSRTSSVSSQVGSIASSSTLPSAPPSYSSLPHQHADGTPLLLDYDGVDDDDEEGGLFMREPQQQYPPPPAYSEVDEDAVNPSHVVQVF